MANLLVIGGTGFFGKSILDGFQRGLLKPWGIETIDIMARQTEEFKDKHTNLINDRVRFHTLDITKCNTLPKAEYVIHAAASSNAINYLMQPEEEKINIQAGIYNYCKLALEYHKHSKIVLCSSGAVYGQQSDAVEFISENTLLEPIGSLAENKKNYAAAKRDAENAFLELGRAGLQVSIARCFAFVGKYLPLNQHFAIGNFIGDALKGQAIRVNAEHRVYRSYLYADDLVEWLLSIAELSSRDCPLFNVGSDEPIEIHKLAEMIAELNNVDVIYKELKNDYIDRYIPSICKAFEYKMAIKYALKDSIKATLRELSAYKIKNEKD